MFKRLSRWLTSVPLRDRVDHRQAVTFQLLLVVWLVIAILGMLAMWLPFLFVPPPPPPTAEPLPPGFFVSFWLILAASALVWLTPLAALLILRRGRFARSVLVAVSGILLTHSMATFAMGLSVPLVPVMFAIPLVLAGLLGGRRLLLTIAGTSIAVALTVGILELQSPPMAGFLSLTSEAQRATDLQMIPMTLGFFCGVIVLLTIVLERFGMTFRQSLAQALEREAQLKTLRDSLEQTVGERTVELSSALGEVQARAAEQAELLGQLDQQQAVIRDLSVPVIPVSEHTLVIPLVGSMDSARMLNLQQQALHAVEQTGARTLILDVTGVALIDSQVAQGLIQTMRAARLIGAEVALVGIRPEVAQTMVGLGIQLSEVRTFSSLHAALAGSTRSGANGQPALAGAGPN